jgi:hypothetical protein
VAKTSEGYGRQFLQAARAGHVFADMYDFGSTVMKFTVADVASRVTAPALVTAYAGDTLVIPPSEQGSEVFRLLRDRKQFHTFTVAKGASSTAPPWPPRPTTRSSTTGSAASCNRRASTWILPR